MSSFGSFSTLLIHTALVYRRQEVEGEYKRDRFGQPSRDEELHHFLPCRLTAARGGETFNDRTHDVAEATHELFLDAGADISEQDVVTVLAGGIDAVKATFDAAEDEETGLKDVLAGFNNTVSRAEVKLARIAHDGTSEHHREVFLSVQRESAEAS